VHVLIDRVTGKIARILSNRQIIHIDIGSVFSISKTIFSKTFRLLANVGDVLADMNHLLGKQVKTQPDQRLLFPGKGVFFFGGLLLMDGVAKNNGMSYDS